MRLFYAENLTIIVHTLTRIVSVAAQEVHGALVRHRHVCTLLALALVMQIILPFLAKGIRIVLRVVRVTATTTIAAGALQLAAQAVHGEGLVVQ